MRITDISLCSLLVLCSFNVSFQTAIKEGLRSEPESREDCVDGETTQTPEATNVRSRNPENVMGKPQLPEENESVPTDTPILKRCARVGSTRRLDSGPIVSLARRDLTERRMKQCEACRNRKTCKERNICNHCKPFCDGLPSPTATDDDTSSSPRPEEKREVTDPPPTNIQDGSVVLTSRFMDEKSQMSRYYSLASTETGPVMRLLEKIFNIPGQFEKYIVLGKMKGTQDGRNVDNIVIIDLAQAFSNEKKIQATVHQFEKFDKIPTDLVNDLNKKLDEAIQRRIGETGNSQLDKDELRKIIDHAFKDVSGNVGKSKEKSSDDSETATRCNVDEAVDDLINIMPYNNNAGPYKPKPPPEEKPQPQLTPQVYETEVESDEIKNPPVIQDNYNLGKSSSGASSKDNIIGDAVEEGYVDDNEEARPVLVTENKGTATKAPIQDAKRPTQKEVNDRKNVVGDVEEVLNVADNTKPSPSSDNQMSETKLQGVNAGGNNFVGESQPGDLEKDVFKIVDDSLKVPSNRQNAESGNVISDIKLQNAGENNFVEKSQPVGLEKDISHIVEDSLRVASSGNVLQNKESDSQLNDNELPRVNADGRNFVGESQSEGLAKDIPQIVEDSLRVASSGQSVGSGNDISDTKLQTVNVGEKNLVQGSQSGDLDKDISQIVDDSLRVASSGNVLQNKESDSQLSDNKLPRVNSGENNLVGDSKPGGLEKDIFQIVEDSLKTVSRGQSAGNQSPAPTGPSVEEEPLEILVEEKMKPSQANSESVVKMIEDPRIKNVQQDLKTHEESNVKKEEETSDSTIVKMEPSEFESRSQFPGSETTQEQSNYFGALVPAKDSQSGVTDPKTKKLFYVGENINLPLKMFQDENGVMKLRVDTDALCNCQNKNCTKRHLEDRFRNAEEEKQDETVLPQLQVRFGEESHKNDQLMDSFVDSLYHNDETSDVFKRSPKDDFGVEDEEKFELENEIVKLNEDIEKYNEANKELLNKGTVALFKEVEKTKDVDRMITLASNLISWMKDLAMKNLAS